MRYKYPITVGYHSQTNFDKELSEYDISSLAFLYKKYMKDLREFRHNFDLSDKNNQTHYKKMQQRFKMIVEEKENRLTMDSFYQNKERRFDTRTGLALDEYGKIIYGVAYDDDDCSGMVYLKDGVRVDSTGEEDTDDETDYVMYSDGSRESVYKYWEYWVDIDDE